MTESIPRRRLRLTYTGTGESVEAEMLDDEAPAVCDFVWSLLPLEAPLVHGKYSGAEVFVLLEDPQEVPPQNLVHLPVPGELFYFFDPGGANTSGTDPQAEICIVYDRGVSLRGPDGLPTFCSLFARIPGDWKYDWTSFAAACALVRRGSAQRLRIERVQ